MDDHEGASKEDLSLARCWEGHCNSMALLAGMANQDQKSRFFNGVIERGEKWVAWSGEPQTPSLGEKESHYGTYVSKSSGGYTVSGTKIFCTSAGAAQRALLLLNTAGPGGARHSTESPDTQLLLACDLSDSTVSVDRSWWNPIGMRATESHLVRFDHTFIPGGNLIGYPGQYLKEKWQTCFVPHYAASFLGASEAAYDYTLSYLGGQTRGHDPFVQQRVAKMVMNIETAHLWLRHVARLWESGFQQEAQLAGSQIRYLGEHLAQEVLDHCIHACGARCLNRPSPIERTHHDLSFYARHDNDDHILANIGKSVLGLPYDLSFYTP